MKAAILGVTGYTGQLLLRLLAEHPEVESLLPVSSSRAGELLSIADPGFKGTRLIPRDTPMISPADAVKERPDVVFAALPHLKSAEICGPFLPGGETPALVIDLSADFRHQDAALFREAYGQEPPRADLLPKAVYGLAELNRKAIAGADLIANPGCYPTATLLPLIPLLKEGLIAPPEEALITVNALSGISGAGKKASINGLFVERSENTNPYSPGMTHRHSREIAEQLSHHGFSLGADQDNLLFTPHLVPLRRGMEITSSVTLTAAGRKVGAVEEALNRTYGECPFITLLPPGTLPQTAQVRGSNRCDMSFQITGNRLLIFSVIDNLMKGASGQAVQNMNIRLGFDETAGLPLQGEV